MSALALLKTQRRHLIPRCVSCGTVSKFEKDLPNSAEGNPREKRRCINRHCRTPFTVQYRGLLTIPNA
jgi:hypothetical protein